LRQLIDGIRFRVRTGCPWRDVPERYGSWQSVYGLFRAWQLAGVWAAISVRLQAAGAEAGVIDWITGWCRWTPPSTGRMPTPPAPAAIPRRRCTRRSANRPTIPGPLPRRPVTEVHLAVEQRRKTLATALTAGQAADSPQFTRLPAAACRRDEQAAVLS
jgi:transposase